MNLQRLFLLMSLERDEFKWYESWDDDWDWLYSENLIQFRGKTEIPTLTQLGVSCIRVAVEGAGNRLENE